MKKTRALLFTLAFTASLVALIVGLRGQFVQFLATHWRNQLQTVPDDRAAVLTAYALARQKPRSPKRLFDRRAELLAGLEMEYRRARSGRRRTIWWNRRTSSR